MILVVDDYDDARDLTARLLRVVGNMVATAESGEAALEFLRENRVSLVIMDVHMPGMSGLDALTRIKANPATENIPVLIVTADTGETIEATALKMGATDFVRKPVDWSVLLQRIAKAHQISVERIGKDRSSRMEIDPPRSDPEPEPDPV